MAQALAERRAYIAASSGNNLLTTSSGAGVELLPVEITPGEQKEPVAALTPLLSTPSQSTVSASSCKVEFRHGNMTLENPSPELLTVLIRELTGRGR